MIGFIEKVGRAIESAAEDFDFGDDDNLMHRYCPCTEDMSLCGTYLAGDDAGPGYIITEEDCVVCIDLMGAPCPRCGQK